MVAVEVVGLLASFAFAVTALSVGVDAVDEFAVFIETVYFRSSQCVGNDGMVFAVGETAQFFAVTSVNGSQIAVAVVVVAIWYRSSERQKLCASHGLLDPTYACC